MPWSTVGSGFGGTPGSSHSPKWKPVSQRNSSCGAGTGRTAARSGCRADAAAPAAYRTHASIDGR